MLRKNVCVLVVENKKKIMSKETFEKIFLLGVLVFWIWGMRHAIKVYMDGVYENKNKPKQR